MARKELQRFRAKTSAIANAIAFDGFWQIGSLIMLCREDRHQASEVVWDFGRLVN